MKWYVWLILVILIPAVVTLACVLISDNVNDAKADLERQIEALQVELAESEEKLNEDLNDTAPAATAANTITATPAPAEEEPETYAAGIAEQETDETVHLFVVNPTAPDQNQNPHPAIYLQTNVSATPVDFILDIPEGYIAIVGGFTIDDETNGVYKAFAPGHVELTITDGFALIIRQEWAMNEWIFRLNEAEDNLWAKDHIYPGPLEAD
jgi:outer membrane murein-binding lipoprotein Lpp